MSSPRRGSARAARLRSTDPRTLATQQLLVAALTTVVTTEGFEKASATRVAQEAGLSRYGFYEHFASVDELSLYVLDELLAEATAADLQARLARGAERSTLPRYAVELLMTSILENRDFYREILLSARAGGVVGHAMERFARSSRRVVEIALPGRSAAELDLLGASVGGSVLGMVLHYLRTDDQRSARELAAEIVEVLPEWMYPSDDGAAGAGPTSA